LPPNPPDKTSKENPESNISLSKEELWNTKLLKKPSLNKFLDKLSNTKLLKEKLLNKSPEKKYIPNIKPLNTKENTFLESNSIPFKNKSPSKKPNTFPYKKPNMLLNKKLSMLLNPDK